MTDKTGFLGLGTAGGVAAGAAAVAALIGVLYATGTLSPGSTVQDEPAAVQQDTASRQTDPAPAQTDTTTPVETADAEPETTATEPAQTETTATEPDPASTAGTETVAPITEPAPEIAETSAEQTPQETAVQTPVSPDRTETSTVSEPTASLGAPQFDVVRAAPDGTTVIAGKADPASTVEVLVDGAVVDTQTADAQGDFVSILSLPPSDQARVVTLLSRLDDIEVLSPADIILAPTPAPQVAAAEPDPQATQADMAQTSGADTSEPAQTAQTTAEASTEPSSTPSAQVQIAQTDATTDTVPSPAAVNPTVTAEPAPVAVLRADADGVELVQPATPDPELSPEQIALDTIGYAPDGAVLLSGRAQADALIRVYLDNTARRDIRADADGRWRAQIDGIAPGVYTLRLDALDAEGAVLSRLETPFKRESPAALASAQPEADTPQTPVPVRQVTVQTGDTLWAISRDRYGDGLLYVRLFEANRDAIRNPDLIYPGQIFAIPD